MVRTTQQVGREVLKRSITIGLAFVCLILAFVSVRSSTPSIDRPSRTSTMDLKSYIGRPLEELLADPMLVMKSIKDVHIMQSPDGITSLPVKDWMNKAGTVWIWASVRPELTESGFISVSLEGRLRGKDAADVVIAVLQNKHPIESDILIESICEVQNLVPSLAQPR